MRYFVVSILFCILSTLSYGQTSGDISASINYQSGNTEIMALTGKVNLDTKFSDDVQSTLTFQTNYSEQFGTVFDRVYRGSFELDVDADDFYPLGFVSVENNLNRRIELRLNGGLGLGFHNNSDILDSKTSVMLLWEYSDMVGIDPISKPMVSVRTRLKKKLESGLSTRLVFLVQRYITQDVYRMNSTFAMSYPIYSSLSFLFTVEHRYETVQVQGVKPNDFSTMFGLEFGI